MKIYKINEWMSVNVPKYTSTSTSDVYDNEPFDKRTSKESDGKYHPQTKDELKKIISKIFKSDGYECDLNIIDTSKITDMSHLFSHTEFIGDISEWDVSNVKNMSYMFSSNHFNGDISKWDVSNVTDMSHMFDFSSFNGDISNWNVSKVNYMKFMFNQSVLIKTYQNGMYPMFIIWKVCLI